MPCSAETRHRTLLSASASAHQSNHFKLRLSGAAHFRILFLLVCCFANNGAHCPSYCECKWKSGKETVICANLNLTIVPRNIESSTQVLDLTGNFIRTLNKHEFYLLNLINLQKLHLAKCKLKSIDRFAFYRLINLIELDLTHNLLTFVPSASFEFIPELRELRLSGNSIARLKSNTFAHVPQLVELEMSGCRINYIELDAFSGLGNTLEVLKLNNNKLVNLNASTITGLINLNSLDLNNNFWNCTCHIKPLRVWLAKQNIPLSIPPTCHFPQRLLHRPWDKLELEDFACKPRVRPLHATYIANEMANVTLECEIWADPVPNITWTRRGKVIANSTSNSVSVVNRRLFDLHRAYNISYLTVFSMDASDAGEYACVAENRGGRTQALLNLSVIKAAPTSDKHSLIQSRLLIHGLFVVLLLIVVLLFVFIYVLVFKNRVRLKATRSAERENYDKIELNHCNASKQELATVEETTRHPKLRQYVSLPEPPDPRSPTGKTPPVSFRGISSPDERLQRIGQNVTRQTGIDPDREPETRDAAIRSYYEENFGEVTLKHHVLRKEFLPSGRLYTTSKQSSKTFPDLLESSPPSNAGQRHMFSTLPRMQSHSSQSSHSRSPLLPSSSQASSMENSSLSSRNHLMDLEMANYNKRNLAVRSEMNSSTSLNLAPELSVYGRRDNPSLPSSPIRHRERDQPRLDPLNKRHSSLCETPILNILEPTRTASRFSMIASTTYDYHAAQLERFLEEYRTLQVELTKMKESCDSFVRNIDREERQTVISSEECDTFSMKPVTTYPTDHDPGPKSILKNKTASNFVARESSFEKTPLHQENPCTEQEMIWDNETRQYVHSMRRTDINRIYYNS
ncbi:uncharacterized protein [Bemisia tabaci]|uniref:uncharacterized protein n=1 Tax=Bemisia tabaci TaxID=7038 RepID=UPI003B28B707